MVIQTEVQYVTNGSIEQELDFYFPSSKNFPVILYLHEGSLISGDKSDNPYQEIAINFANHGIGFVLANYRLAPGSKWPAMAEDAASAFAWIKKNAKKYFIDTANLFIMGHSSGALIAAAVCTDDKYLKKTGQQLSGIKACIIMGTLLNPSFDTDVIPDSLKYNSWQNWKHRQVYETIFETPEAYRDSDPFRHLNSEVPSFLILIAEEEQINPPILEQAHRFAKELKKLKVEVKIEVLKNRRHITAMQKMAEENDPTLITVSQFIKNLRK